MKIYYRISNNSYKKNRLEHATKEHCLDNFLSIFKNYLINLIADNVTEQSLLDFIKTKESDTFKIEYTSLNNAQCFKHCLNRAVNECKNDDIIYFVEDDYLHLPNSYMLLLEGIERADYVSGYDHPDKYIDGYVGGNPQIENGGEITRVISTKSSHWKLTNSTTCTFATTGNILKEDLEIWNRYLGNNSYPDDYKIFTHLIQDKGRSLITPIPSFSTHTQIEWLAPRIDWTII